MDWYLGTVGFSYKEWRGVFYPEGLSPRRYLAYYSQRFNAIEIDSTFYGIPRVEHLQRWAEMTPHDFIFTLKTPQTITHQHRLIGAGGLMAEFIAVVRHLGERLGPILLQLPPSFTTAQMSVLADFLASLPVGVRYAIEFRDRSWEETAATADLLAEHQICWVAADYIHLSKAIRRTTDFLYLRWLGEHGRFKEKNREQLDLTPVLQHWQQEITRHSKHVEAVFGFFNNDFAGYSPASCNRFKQMVGLPVKDLRIMQQRRLL